MEPIQTANPEPARAQNAHKYPRDVHGGNDTPSIGKPLRILPSDVMMLLVMVCWGLNLSLIKLSLAEIPPMPFNAIRLTLASIVLLAVLLISEHSLAIQKRHLWRILILSVSGHTIYQYLFITGFDHTTAANTSVILATSPIMISILSTFFKHERITPLGWCGIGLGFVGVYIVISGKSGLLHLSAESIKGDLILFAAVFLWAHYSVSSRPLLKIYSPLRFSTVTMGIGSLFFLPLSCGSFKSANLTAVSFKAWACLAYSGIFALSLASILWFTSIKRVGNSQTAIFSNLQPVLAVFFAHFILGEKITPSLLIGMAVIFLGIFLTRQGRLPSQRRS